MYICISPTRLLDHKHLRTRMIAYEMIINKNENRHTERNNGQFFMHETIYIRTTQAVYLLISFTSLENN